MDVASWTAMDAQVKALKKEFGSQTRQPFIRPKYNFVHSPLYQKGLKVSPQRYIDDDGKTNIVPRRFDCPHIINHVDLVSNARYGQDSYLGRTRMKKQ